MFSRKEVQVIFILTMVVLLGSGVYFAAYSHFSKAEPIATDDFSDFNTLMEGSGEDLGYIVEDEQVDPNSVINDYQLYEREYNLEEALSGGFAEKVEKKEYIVSKGDTIYSLAKKFGIDEEVLKYNNPDLDKYLKVGLKITVYNGDYISYKVEKGETLLSIANKFGVDVTDILRVNGLETTEVLPGRELILKNPDLKSYKDRIAQDKIDKNQIVELKTKPLSRPKGASSAGKATGGGKIGKSVGGFAIKWPVRWAGVNSGWGRRYHPIYGRYIFHQGIDTPVRYESCYAAADGTVSYAGNMSGYGKIIIIKHKNGYETRYAHMNKLSVKVGQSVKMGEYIGQTGATGKVTGPHLHFEVRLNGNSLNPMNFR